MLRTVPSGCGGIRRRCSLLALLVGLSLYLSLPLAAGAQARPADERLRKLEAEVAALKAELAALQAAAKPATAPPTATVDELSRRIDLLAAEIERLQLGEAAPEATRGEKGLGPAASKIYRTGQGLAIGGYGDLLYQHFASRRDDGGPSEETDTLDLERAVLYFGYKLSDRFLFNSELEFEHAKTEEGAAGEAAIEFAYLDYLYEPALNFRAGLVLVPMGFLNELHEPTTFLSTERPLAERVVIPTTWRENGFGLFGDAGSFTYRAYVVNGMDATRYEGEEGLAEGKQEGSLAKAENFAVVGRLDYQGVPGLLVGASVYGGDAGQDLRDEGGARSASAPPSSRGTWSGARTVSSSASSECARSSPTSPPSTAPSASPATSRWARRSTAPTWRSATTSSHGAAEPARSPPSSAGSASTPRRACPPATAATRPTAATSSPSASPGSRSTGWW